MGTSNGACPSNGKPKMDDTSPLSRFVKVSSGMLGMGLIGLVGGVQVGQTQGERIAALEARQVGIEQEVKDMRKEVTDRLDRLLERNVRKDNP